MSKQIQRALVWIAAFFMAVGMLFLPVSKAYAGPVSGGSSGSGEMRGVWVSYLDWNQWPKDEAGYKKAMDQTLDLCVQKGLNTVFLQVRPDGDAMYPSQYFPWSKFASGKQGKNPGYDPLAYAVQAAHQRGLQLHAWINPYRITGYLNRYSDLCASNPAIAWAKDGDSSNDRWVLCQNGEYYYNPAILQVRQLIINGVKEIVTNYEVDGIHFDDYFYPNLDDSKVETWFDYPEYKASGTSLSVAAWRRNNVNELVKGVYSAVKSIRPQASFGISPEGYLQNLRKDTRQFTDVDTWMTQSGYVDYLMPQIYWGFEAKQNGQAAGYAFANCLNEWVTLKKKGNVKLYVGLALYKTGTDAADGNAVPEWQRYHDIMKREVEAGRATGQVSGYCFYDLSSLTRAAAAEEVANVTALFH